MRKPSIRSPRSAARQTLAGLDSSSTNIASDHGVGNARRGEVFAAGWRGREPVLAQAALAPAGLAERLAAEGGRWLAVGDGALRFRTDLEGAGCSVPPDDCAQHRVSGRAICGLALRAGPQVARDLVVPDYLRLPDAVLARHQPAR